MKSNIKHNNSINGTCCNTNSKLKKNQNIFQNENHFKSDCIVCNARIEYFTINLEKSCYYCNRTFKANAICTNGHYVCDKCHSSDAVETIKNICLNRKENDIVTLMQSIRNHPNFSIHGPEHHSMVPAIILTALRNNGEDIKDEQIITAIERGQSIGGGSCAFLGACGAAIGVGIAISMLSNATPYDGKKRQKAQLATQKALLKIGSFDAPRCCQRDSWLALNVASEIIYKMIGKTLIVNQIICDQYLKNKECIHKACPLWPTY